MINIYNKIYNKIYKLIKNSNFKDIKDKIIITNSLNIDIYHIKINGIQFFIKKFNLKEEEILNNLKIELLKLSFIYKINIDNDFINIFINNNYIEKKIVKIIKSNKLIFKLNKISKNIIIDYSSPNLMKEMHVGHLKSTIIGDSLSKILKFLGNNIIKINHVGDWGINFGMTICKIIELNKHKDLTIKKISIDEIENIYKISKLDYKNNLSFAEKSQICLLKLQNKNNLYNKIWKILTKISIKNNQYIYKELNIDLKINNIIGESFYKNMIPNVINDLLKKNIAKNKNGLILIPLKNTKNRYGKKMCAIIQKKNNTHLYLTTEITSIKYRCEFFKPYKIIYFIDKRQSNHFKQSFYIAKKAKYITNSKLEFHSFGMILNKDKKPLKTREGDSFKLKELIKESIEKTKIFLLNKNKNLNINEINKLSKIIGIGSLKYFDLSRNKNNNYIFDIDKILSLKDNTAIYIYYSYVRILSILKKNKINNLNYLSYKNFKINNKEELDLSLLIIKFEFIIHKVSKLCTPNLLCLYLYEISKKFSKFYSTDKIIYINNIDIKNTKLNLCILTSNIIKKGLELLGIKIIKKI
ncbi:arginine--tRNA ligase [endosymbiont of Pachyrhynchus infernalis]|uniref:arginine--tRNA ligase n=1 Tax=endosymbiont of Pachyrhynchus infernalis TaxID=1971488 RepID=UPI000DC6E254|nr:arginine--tRNA ligase [endosymbiont of Pachyrhynchus infernalis]BBA84894.1 arginine--tRNA ligase [endosymbiont of Pachyrhynchus infernalis]